MGKVDYAPVYRLEYGGVGIYASRDIEIERQWSNRHPGPSADPDLLRSVDHTVDDDNWTIMERLAKKHDTERSNLLFGFGSFCQMIEWFDYAELGRLVDQGAAVFRYLVEPRGVIYGTKQVVFHRQTIVEKQELTRVAKGIY